MKIEQIKAIGLKPNVLRHKVVPSGFIERVVKYKEVLKEVETSSLAGTIRNFQRDLHPENELLLWEKMATLYKSQSESNPNLTLESKKAMFKAILSDFV